MRIDKIIFNNFWLKIFSLMLAIAAWVYVFDVLEENALSDKKNAIEQVFSRFQFSVKEVRIKPAFTGNPPEGYVLDYEKVIVEPSMISIFGPKRVLEKIDFLTTMPVNVSEYTRSVKVETGIRSKFKYLRFGDKAVEVYLPISKKEELK